MTRHTISREIRVAHFTSLFRPKITLKLRARAALELVPAPLKWDWLNLQAGADLRQAP